MDAVLAAGLFAFVVALIGIVLLARGGSAAAPSSDQAAARKVKRDPATTFYTAAEVAKHASRDDLWMIIDGKVYDVTDEVEDHVGGDMILKNAGKDNSVGFHGQQHTSSAHDSVRQYLIGTLREEGTSVPSPDKKKD